MRVAAFFLCSVLMLGVALGAPKPDPACRRKVPLPPRLERFDNLLCDKNLKAALALSLAPKELQYRDEEKETPLFWPARMGLPPVVAKLIAAGAVVNTLNKSGDSILYQAVSERSLATVELLLRNGADPNLAGPGRTTPLTVAAATGDLKLCASLVEKGAKLDPDAPGATPLDSATGQNRDEVITWLVSQGAKVDKLTGEKRTALMSAALGAREKSTQTLIRAGADVALQDPQFGLSALAFACGQTALPQNRLQVVKDLLAAGAPVSVADQHGQTPLMMASGVKNLALLPLLAAAGADLKSAEGEGAQALAQAIVDHRRPTALALLELGAPARVVIHHDRSALFYAIEIADDLLVKALLDHGADPNEVRKERPISHFIALPGEVPPKPVEFTKTPLLDVVQGKRPALVRVLLAAGADPAFKDNFGRTALDYAKQQGSDEIIRLLSEAGR